MQFTRFFLVLAAAAAVFSASASAQTKSTSFETQTLPLSLADARTMADIARATCHAMGYQITVLIVDPLGKPKFLMRDDGKKPSTWETANVKAYTAVLFGRPSGQNLPPGPLGHYTPTVTPGVTRAKGGIPIIVGDLVIGAIAVAGAPEGDKDEICAAAGLAKVAEKLGAKTMAQMPKPRTESAE
jgi:uncharacterized protein GlcG (DUF336 family)